MAWYARQSSHLDRLSLSRLLELYSLMKRWREAIPELPWTSIDELEIVLQNPALSIDELLLAETSREMLDRIEGTLKQLLSDWDRSLGQLRKTHGPVISRMLRFTEEEALRYTSEQWRKFRPEQFGSLAPVYSAYRETPFFALYRDAVVIVRHTKSELTFLTRHPVLEMEQAWMRGFVMYLRPSIHVDQREVGDQTAFHWRDA